MNLTLPPGVRLFGDPTYRGKCPREVIEQVSVINRIRQEYPTTWGLLAFHPRNEQLLERGQFSSVIKHKAEGMTAGFADLVVVGCPAFVCEIKRRDHTLSTWQPGQREHLEAAANAGAFACVALGAVAAYTAFEEWLACAKK